MRRRLLPIASCFLVILSNPTGATAETIIGAAKSKIYHNHPKDCSSARRISGDNRTRFASKEEAEREGRRQCKICAKLDKKEVEKKADAADSDGVHERTIGDTARSVPPPVRVVSHDSIDGASASSLPQFAHAKHVLGGGTIELDTGDKACLLGVVVPRRWQPAARDAHRFLEEQTEGRLLRLTPPDVRSAMSGRDPLGRWRVSVMPKGGRDLAGELLFHGYAWLDRDHLTGRSAEYARQEAAAWSAKRGIWRPLDGEDGARTVVTGRGATAYHDPKCEHVRHLTEPMRLTVNEARARRLVPCSEYRAKGAEKSGQD